MKKYKLVINNLNSLIKLLEKKVNELFFYKEKYESLCLKCKYLQEKLYEKRSNIRVLKKEGENFYSEKTIIKIDDSPEGLIIYI